MDNIQCFFHCFIVNSCDLYDNKFISCVVCLLIHQFCFLVNLVLEMISNHLRSAIMMFLKAIVWTYCVRNINKILQNNPIWANEFVCMRVFVHDNQAMICICYSARIMSELQFIFKLSFIHYIFEYLNTCFTIIYQ